MKEDLQLKVQAWLDGELPDHEARQLGEWIATDAEASALVAELGSVHRALSGNETHAVLTDSRDFYWSKIERQIRREAAQAPVYASIPWYARLRRYMAPLAGVAVLACALLMAVVQRSSAPVDETSSTGGGMEALTFHDQSAGMTVVWLQDNSAPAEEKPLFNNALFEDEPGTVIDL